MNKANELIRERYSPYRAEHGKRLPFETAEFRPLLSPFDRTPIAMVGYMTESQAMENLETLTRSFHERRAKPARERAAILKRAAQRMSDRKEALADLIAWEGGKPLKDARIEVTRAIVSVELAAEEAVRLHGDEVPMRATAAAAGHLAFTTPEPIGVVLAISAFNHPVNLIAHQVAPAVAVGCPVMVKPAAETPLSCLHFLDALYESGLEPEMCLPLICDNEIAEKIARSSKIAFMSFIGSARVGWHLRSVLAPGTRLALEHGGSAPAIVDRSTDLALALPTLVKGGFYHAGQVCVSTQRILVHEDLGRKFENALVAAVRALKTGNPRLETVDCGPIIRKRDLERIHDRVTSAIEAGAKCLTGGRPSGETTYEPTVLSDVPEDHPLWQEEIFGPVVMTANFRELEDAVRSANNVPWSFQAAVFGNEMDRLLQCARDLNASAVMMNESTAFRVDWMPFRGDGPSGFGTGGIPFTMREMTREKLFVMKTP